MSTFYLVNKKTKTFLNKLTNWLMPFHDYPNNVLLKTEQTVIWFDLIPHDCLLSPKKNIVRIKKNAI